jgi:excisionase family DNA binding protein
MSVVDANGRWLTVQDAAQVLGKSERVVRSAIRRRDLTAYKLGGPGDPYSILPRDLDAFIESRRYMGAVAVIGGGDENRVVV